MLLQSIALFFLVMAIVLGFVRKINVGIVSLGMALVLALIGGVKISVLFTGFPTKLFLTLLGTMFFFCLLQENHTLELLSKKIVSALANRQYLVPVIVYLVSYVLSAVGPGAISVQSVMVIFAVSLAVQMKTSPLLVASMAILGAVGGTASPIALTGIIVTDLTMNMNLGTDVATPVFYGVSAANFLCAVIVYFLFKGYKLKSVEGFETEQLPSFNSQQKIGIFSIVLLVVAVVGFRYDVGFVSFSLALGLILCRAVNEKKALQLVPWNVLLLICGVNVLMSVTQAMGGIKLLSNLLAMLMNQHTAASVIGIMGGVMSWFSSANGVVFPTLIPTVPDIVRAGGGNADAVEMIMAIVGGATVAGISPLSTGGSLILASYTQETNASEETQQALFAKLFVTSFGMVTIVAVFSFLGAFKIFC